MVIKKFLIREKFQRTGFRPLGALTNLFFFFLSPEEKNMYTLETEAATSRTQAVLCTRCNFMFTLSPIFPLTTRVNIQVASVPVVTRIERFLTKRQTYSKTCYTYNDSWKYLNAYTRILMAIYCECVVEICSYLIGATTRHDYHDYCV